LQLFEDFPQFGELRADVDWFSNGRRLVSELGAKFRGNRVAASGDHNAADYRARAHLVSFRHKDPP
jgi:hypothetical protein